MSIQIIQKRQKEGRSGQPPDPSKSSASKTNTVWQKSKKKKWQSAQAAVMLGDPGIKGTEGPSALSYGVDFERTGEELDRRRIHSRGCSDRLTNMTELTLMPCSSFALIVDSIC